jgi:hypothetical protein
MTDGSSALARRLLMQDRSQCLRRQVVSGWPIRCPECGLFVKLRVVALLVTHRRPALSRDPCCMPWFLCAVITDDSVEEVPTKRAHCRAAPTLAAMLPVPSGAVPVAVTVTAVADWVASALHTTSYSNDYRCAQYDVVNDGTLLLLLLELRSG